MYQFELLRERCMNWMRGKMTPSPVAVVPRRYWIPLVGLTVVTGELFFFTLVAVIWNMLAGFRNRIALGL